VAPPWPTTSTPAPTNGPKFARSLPWRLALVIAAGALAGTLTHGAGPREAGPAAALAAGLVGWRLCFRVSAETTAWRRGARGERRTARHLHKLIRAGWTVLHDVAVPGSRANGDHLLIGPPRVFLIDTKAWHGRITQAIDGAAWHNGHPLDRTIATVRWEGKQLAGALGAPVLPLLCVHDTRIPWDEIYVDNGAPAGHGGPQVARSRPPRPRSPAVTTPDHRGYLPASARVARFTVPGW
jgi:hypothetical protein